MTIEERMVLTGEFPNIFRWKWRNLWVLLCLISSLVWQGCQLGAQSSSQEMPQVSPLLCQQVEAQIDVQDRIDTLRHISQAFSAGCDETVITYGTQAQAEYKYKTFSVLKETSNIFLPDGTFIDYVLESYERGFLTVLLAASFYHLHDFDASKEELRRLDHEIFTPLYNYGADPVNLLFSAVFWEMVGEPDEARVDWNRLQEQEGQNEDVRTFASHRLAQLDAQEGFSKDWSVYAIGNFPGTDWNIEFKDSSTGYFTVNPQQPFLTACSSKSGVRISTKSWFQKIALRHDPGYHPLLHAQSWLRLPVGVVYSISTFTAGASILVGGCYLDVAGEGDGSLCKLSVKGGMALIRKSPKVLRHTLRPDLRHWDSVPSSFLFTTSSSLQEESCFTDLSYADKNVTKKFFGIHQSKKSVNG